MKFPFVLIASLLSLRASAQALYASQITLENLRKYEYILASKDLEGRETGTPGADRAAKYIAGVFYSLGLNADSNCCQEFPVYSDSLLSAEVRLDGREYELNRDFSVLCALDHDDTLDVSSVGPGTPVRLFSKGESLAYVLTSGARAVLLVRDIADEDTSRTTYHVRAPRIPNVFVVSKALGRAIQRKHPHLHLSFAKEVRTLNATNVVGIIEGNSRKDEVVLITAHYDHLGTHDGKIYYGADDNASGVGALLEIAQAFAQAKADGHGPSRTLVFVAFSGEEEGLLGSSYYVNNPLFPLEKTKAVLNMDMVGRGARDSLFLIGENADARELLKTLNDRYTHLHLSFRYDEKPDTSNMLQRSDQYPFFLRSVPVAFFFGGMHGDYHQPTDTPDKIDYPLYRLRAQLVFYTAWAIANLP